MKVCKIYVKMNCKSYW